MRLNASRKKRRNIMQTDRLLNRFEWETEEAVASLIAKGLIEEVFDEDGKSLGYRKIEGVTMECYIEELGTA